MSPWFNAQGLLSRRTEICPVKEISLAAPFKSGAEICAAPGAQVIKITIASARRTRTWCSAGRIKQDQNSTANATEGEKPSHFNGQLPPNQRFPKRAQELVR